AVHEPGALVGLELLERGHLDAAALRETEQRLARIALGVEARARRRTAALERLVGLARADRTDQHREAARAPERARARRLARDAALGKSGDHAVAKRLRELGQRLGRQFLGAELDQQRGALVDRRAHAACALSPGKPRRSLPA